MNAIRTVEIRHHTCLICSEIVEDVCPDGNCHACHKTLSFEACCDGSWVKKFRQALGAPPLEI